jgi:pectate lyase
MKFSLPPTVFVLLAPIVLAVPTPTEQGPVERARIAKRATISDVADTGYATQNGG